MTMSTSGTNFSLCGPRPCESTYSTGFRQKECYHLDGKENEALFGGNVCLRIANVKQQLRIWSRKRSRSQYVGYLLNHDAEISGKQAFVCALF